MKGEKRTGMWIVTGILTLVSMVVMYMVHKAVVFTMDDNWYATMLYNDTPITSIWDIIQSQIWHYYHWGGRSIAHGILQMTLLAGERAADILNLLVTALLGGMVCIVSENRRFPAFFAAVSMTLGLNANWHLSMFWQSGAANYLYMTVFILAFIHCYLRELPEDDQGTVRGKLPGITLWIIPLGIAAGWSNENMGTAVWFLSMAVIFLVLKETRKIKPWMALGSLSCLVGSIMCIAAPGNFVRLQEVNEDQYGILWRFFLRCYRESKAALDYLFPTLLVLGFLWIVSKYVLKQKVCVKEVLLLLCALLSWGAMVLSPHYPDRASFGTMLLCICEILILARKILRQRSDLAWPLWFGAVLIWLRGMYYCGEYLAVLWGWIRE